MNSDIATYLPFVVGILLPLVVGYATKASTPSSQKAVLHVVLAIIAGPLVAWQAAGFSSSFDITQALEAAALVYATGIITHSGFYQPTGIAAAVANSGNKDAAGPVGVLDTAA